MKMVAPLKKVKGLGSAKDGTGHWLAQRISALALIFLIAWLFCSSVSLIPLNYAVAVNFLYQPHNSLLLILFIASIFYHGYLGIQVVIEDYVHSNFMKYSLLIGLKLLSLFAAVASIFTIITIFLKS
jgi:succinate dehydrogenase / fumarate reductase membrane anchor subunit